MTPRDKSALNTAIAIRLQMSGQLTVIAYKDGETSERYKLRGDSIAGSDKSADICLNDPLISPEHARIYKERNWWIIEDLRSENGTFVNGSLIQKAPLFPDSEILMGNTLLNVVYSEKPQVETAVVRHSGEWVQLPRIIAHELKNYLQFFDAEIEQLKQDSEIIDRYSGQIKSLEMAGEKMDELVQMLRAGCVKPGFMRVNLVDVIWEQAALIETRAKTQDVNMIFDIPDKPVEIEADSNQIGRAVLNFLKNALESLTDKGSVYLSLTYSSNEAVAIDIRDTGHGMDSETLQSFWTPLFTTRSNGNGLGAFIARAAILKHKGTVQVESEPGKGTAIHIELPRKQKNR
jgi:signal transduction histidine kinase